MPHQTRSPQRNWGTMVAPHPGPWGLHPVSLLVAGLWARSSVFSPSAGSAPRLGGRGGVRAQVGMRRGQG